MKSFVLTLAALAALTFTTAPAMAHGGHNHGHFGGHNHGHFGGHNHGHFGGHNHGHFGR